MQQTPRVKRRAWEARLPKAFFLFSDPNFVQDLSSRVIVLGPRLDEFKLEGSGVVQANPAVSVDPLQVPGCPVGLVQVGHCQRGPSAPNRNVGGAAIVALALVQAVTGSKVGVVVAGKDDVHMVVVQDRFQGSTKAEANVVFGPQILVHVEGSM